ncbi:MULTISPECIES: hypothetical protein [unclassified Thiocapsa]
MKLKTNACTEATTADEGFPKSSTFPVNRAFVGCGPKPSTVRTDRSLDAMMPALQHRSVLRWPGGANLARDKIKDRCPKSSTFRVFQPIRRASRPAPTLTACEPQHELPQKFDFSDRDDFRNDLKNKYLK